MPKRKAAEQRLLLDDLRRMAAAAESISDSDIVSRSIR